MTLIEKLNRRDALRLMGLTGLSLFSFACLGILGIGNGPPVTNYRTPQSPDPGEAAPSATTQVEAFVDKIPPTQPATKHNFNTEIVPQNQVDGNWSQVFKTQNLESGEYRISYNGMLNNQKWDAVVEIEYRGQKYCIAATHDSKVGTFSCGNTDWNFVPVDLSGENAVIVSPEEFDQSIVFRINPEDNRFFDVMLPGIVLPEETVPPPAPAAPPAPTLSNT